MDISKMSVDDFYKYLEENYPDEEPEKKLENFAEKEPEKASQLGNIIPKTAQEAKQVLDNNPRNDEANNAEIRKDIGLLNGLSKHDTNTSKEVSETNQIPETSTKEVQEGEPDVEAGDRSVESGNTTKPSISDEDFDSFVNKVDEPWTAQKELDSMKYPEGMSPEEKERLRNATISSFSNQGGAADALRYQADLIDRGVDYDEDTVANLVYNMYKDDDSKSEWQGENLGDDPDKAASRLRWKSNWVSNKSQPYSSVEELNQDSSIKEGDVKKAFENNLKEFNKPKNKGIDWDKVHVYKPGEEELKDALANKDAQKVENVIESNPGAAENVIPESNPIRKEVDEMTDGDKRTNEVNNQVVHEGLKKGVFNTSFDRFEQLSPEEQKLRVKFNEKYNMTPEERDALHNFSGELDRADIERAKAQAEDDYMDDDEKRELAQWIEANVPAPVEEEEIPEEEEEEEKKHHKIPKLLHPKLAHSSINNMRLDTDRKEGNYGGYSGYRAPGSNLLGNVGSHSNLSGGYINRPNPAITKKFATVDPLRVSGSIDYSRNAPNEVQHQSRGVVGPGTSMFGGDSGMLKTFDLNYRNNRGGNIGIGQSGIKANFTGFTGGGTAPIYAAPMGGGNNTEDIEHKLLIDIPTIKQHIMEIWPNGHEEPGLSVQILGKKILINGTPIEEVDEATMRKIQNYFWR